jgi:hypothetical protein
MLSITSSQLRLARGGGLDVPAFDDADFGVSGVGVSGVGGRVVATAVSSSVP